MSDPPVCSVIIPARNEAARIGACVRAVRETAHRYPVEIIVVDGQSADRTVEEARTAGAIVIASPVVGRGAQMHWGAQRASGEVLVFVHADTTLPAEWQDGITWLFYYDPQPPVAVAFRVTFDSARRWYALIAYLANLRAEITQIPHGDQALVVTRRAYVAAGRLSRLRGRCYDFPVFSPGCLEGGGPFRDALSGLQGRQSDRCRSLPALRVAGDHDHP